MDTKVQINGKLANIYDLEASEVAVILHALEYAGIHLQNPRYGKLAADLKAALFGPEASQDSA